MTEREKILIVDDDHDTLDLLEIFLYRNYEIITAVNGFEATARIEEEHPSLIMTDIKMPVMDGIALLNNLRKRPATNAIPVIAITSFTKEHATKSLLNLGFSGVISKPPVGKAVVELIGKLLGKEESDGGREEGGTQQ